MPRPKQLRGVANNPKDDYRWIALPKSFTGKIRHAPTRAKLSNVDLRSIGYKIVRRPPHKSRGKKMEEIKKGGRKKE